MESSEKLSLFTRICHFFIPLVNVLRCIFCCRCVSKEDDQSAIKTRLFTGGETPENTEKNTDMSMREINKINEEDVKTEISQLNIKTDDAPESSSDEDEFFDASDMVAVEWHEST